MAPDSTNAKDGLVKVERTAAEVDDPDQKPVEAGKQIKAYNYGKQLVPVPGEQEGVLKYKPGGASSSQEGATKGGDEEEDGDGVKVQH